MWLCSVMLINICITSTICSQINFWKVFFSCDNSWQSIFCDNFCNGFSLFCYNLGNPYLYISSTFLHVTVPFFCLFNILNFHFALIYNIGEGSFCQNWIHFCRNGIKNFNSVAMESWYFITNMCIFYNYWLWILEQFTGLQICTKDFSFLSFMC